MNVQDNVSQLKEFGPVHEMVLPQDWLEKKLNKQKNDLKSFVKFYHPDNEDVQICVYYKGLPVSDQSSLLFSKVLSSNLTSLTVENLDSLQEVLGNLAITDEFKIESANLEQLNDKKVLQVCGQWINHKLKAKSYFIDAREDGSIVYEIYYAAPVDLYDKHLVEVDKAFASISWQLV